MQITSSCSSDSSCIGDIVVGDKERERVRRNRVGEQRLIVGDVFVLNEAHFEVIGADGGGVAVPEEPEAIEVVCDNVREGL